LDCPLDGQPRRVHEPTAKSPTRRVKLPFALNDLQPNSNPLIDGALSNAKREIEVGRKDQVASVVVYREISGDKSAPFQVVQRPLDQLGIVIEEANTGVALPA
jgi:hypothetical protein